MCYLAETAACVTSQKLPRYQAPEPFRPLQHSMSFRRLKDCPLRIYCAILKGQNAYLRDWPSVNCSMCGAPSLIKKKQKSTKARWEGSK